MKCRRDHLHIAHKSQHKYETREIGTAVPSFLNYVHHTVMSATVQIQGKDSERTLEGAFC